MERQIKPSLFYGTALWALLGLALGLAFHGPWQSHSDGPQILFSSAAAAELARPPGDNDIIETAAPDAAPPAQDDLTDLDVYQLPPDSLPVVRLTRMGGQPIPDPPEVQEAALDTPIDQPERVSADQVDDAPPPAAETDERRIVAASYGPADDAR